MLVHTGNNSLAPSSSTIRPTNPLPATGIIPAPGTAGTLQSLAPTMALNVTGMAAVSLYVEGAVGPLCLAPLVFAACLANVGRNRVLQKVFAVCHCHCISYRLGKEASKSFAYVQAAWEHPAMYRSSRSLCGLGTP